MTTEQIRALLAMSNKEDAHYLPMKKGEFIELFDIAIESGEISGVISMPASDNNEYVVAYVMNNCLYQSSNPNHKLSELFS